MDFEAVNWDVGSEAKELDKSLFQKSKKNKGKNSKKRRLTENKTKITDSTEHKKRKLDNKEMEHISGDTLETKGNLKAVAGAVEESSEPLNRKEKRNKKWQEKILRRKLADEKSDTKGLTNSGTVSEFPSAELDNCTNKIVQTGKNKEVETGAKSPMNRTEKRKLRWEEIKQKKKLMLEQSKLVSDTQSGSKNQQGNEIVSDKICIAENVNKEGPLNRRERKKLLWKQKLKERKQSQKVENVNESTVNDKKDENGMKQKNENSQESQNVSKQNIIPKKRKLEKKMKLKHNNENISNDSNSLDNKQLHSPKKKVEVEEKNTKEKSDTEVKSVKKKMKRKRICKRNKFKGYVKPEPGTVKAELDVTKDSTENIESSGSEMDVNEKDDTRIHEVSSTIKGSVQSKEGKKKKKKKQKPNDGSVNNKTSEEEKTKSIKEALDKKGGKDIALKKGGKKVSLDPNVLKTMLSPGPGKKASTLAAEDDDEAQDFSIEKKTDTKAKTLLEKSRERLNAARFRYLNEQLYTTTGQDAFKMFKNDDVAFNVYHEGFQHQVEKWPTNPVDVIIQKIQSKPKHLILADFGCGDAKLARSVPNKVHSFDLVALNDHVTVCDMSKVPLKDGTVDIAVFCLSLMGTNLTSYLQEANRVLKNNGTMMIAEVASRFHSVGSFVLQVEKMGFKIKQQDSANKMFVMMEFKKTAECKDKTVEDIALKPCIYKKR